MTKELAMITAVRWSQRDEFPQGQKRHERKEYRRPDGADQERDGEDHHHYPPRVDPCVEVRDHFLRALVAGPRPQNSSDDRRNQEQGDDASDEPARLRIAHARGAS